MADFDWCAEAERKAALWDAVGEPALALLRETQKWLAWHADYYPDDAGVRCDPEITRKLYQFRALLARSEEAER